MNAVKVIAHRGASAYEPENSFAAFEKALEMGTHSIEMDVRTTFDGEAVLMHDETVNRTTDGVGKVSEMELADIKKLRLRNGQDIPLAREALDLLKGRCQVNLELKDSDSPASAGRVVREMKLFKDVIFSSFHGPWLVDLKLRHPGARIAFICDDKKLDCVRIASSLQAEAVNIGARIATRKLILKAREDGLDVNVWTVNNPRRMRKFMDMGIDGIFTDKPDVLATVLENRNAGKEGTS